MKTLHVSDSFKLPPEAITETFAVLGKRGSGKTNFAVVLVEELVGAGLPVVVIDPVGVWFGLRASADAKEAGLPVTILGGEHGDVPLEEGAGAVIADFVIEARQPCVIDLSLLRKGQQIRFMTDFAERLYHAKGTKRDALHVVVDESDAFAPQNPRPESARLLGAMEDLVRRGRSRGLGLTLITQRPASLNKNVLTQAEVLVVFQMVGPLDRKAIDEWVKMNGSEDERAQLLASIASLPVGTAWVWSPSWLKTFQKVAVRRRRTFDSSATPKAGAKRIEPRVLAPVDLAALRDRIAETIERAKADDPKELHKRIVELEKQLRAMPAAQAAPAKEKRVEVPVVRPADVKRLETAADAVGKACTKAIVEAVAILKAIERVAGAAPGEPVLVEGKVAGFTKPHAPREPAARATTTGTKPRAMVSNTAANSATLRTGERKMLEVLARHHPRALTRTQLGSLVGLPSGKSTFGTYMSTLKTRELVALGDGTVRLSDAGVEMTGAVDGVPMTRDEILEVWMPRLRAGERKMLTVVCEEGEIDRDSLGELVELPSTKSTFGTYLSTLRSNDLVRVNGKRVAIGEALEKAS